MFNTSLCPDEYYDNCANAITHCNHCVASGNKNGKLHYKPIEDGLPNHPYSKNSSKQKRLKEAKQVEKAIIDSVARATVRSGAANGDGDCHLLNGDLRVEIKDRGEKSSWNVTFAEYEKGKRQGIDIYSISVLCPDKVRRTMYMIEEELYHELISQLSRVKKYESKSVSEEV